MMWWCDDVMMMMIVSVEQRLGWGEHVFSFLHINACFNFQKFQASFDFSIYVCFQNFTQVAHSRHMPCTKQVSKWFLVVWHHAIPSEPSLAQRNIRCAHGLAALLAAAATPFRSRLSPIGSLAMDLDATMHTKSGLTNSTWAQHRAHRPNIGPTCAQHTRNILALQRPSMDRAMVLLAVPSQHKPRALVVRAKQGESPAQLDTCNCNYHYYSLVRLLRYIGSMVIIIIIVIFVTIIMITILRWW